MPKGQHGNKEAKKPKKAASPKAPATPLAAMPAGAQAAADRPRKK